MNNSLVDSIAQRFDTTTLHRLFRRSSVKRLVVVLKLLLAITVVVAIAAIAFSAWSVIDATSDTVTRIDREIAQVAKSTTEASPAPEAPKSYGIIARRSIFGEIGATPAPATRATPPPQKTEMPLVLIGTFTSEIGEPYAIIGHIKKKSEDVFEIQDTVFDEAELIKILSDRVELKRDGKTEILTLDDLPGGGSASDSDSSGVIFTVDENELDAALDNLPLLLTQARAVPYFKEGRSVGLRLFAIKRGSLFEKIGLKNGDILKSINGNDMGDLTQAVKLFEKLKEERDITLTLERNRQPQIFKYRIQ